MTSWVAGGAIPESLWEKAFVPWLMGEEGWVSLEAVGREAWRSTRERLACCRSPPIPPSHALWRSDRNQPHGSVIVERETHRSGASSPLLSLPCWPGSLKAAGTCPQPICSHADDRLTLPTPSPTLVWKKGQLAQSIASYSVAKQPSHWSRQGLLLVSPD